MRNEDPNRFRLDDDPLWYKDAIIYEVHVRAFCDSNGDGVGDFPGLTRKLDYLQALGVTAIWLLPFYPSPLKDDGYDVADYDDVHPAYGHLRDVRQFIQEAHRRGLRVVTELICNHTSDQHPWFQKARRAPPGSAQRNWYVWSDTPDRYKDTRIVFQDFESSNWSWDAVAGAYYWHRFYSHQPDLNFENPRVHKAILDVMRFWLQMGVDGLRLDAVPYIYEQEGTACENLPQTHAFLRQLRRQVDERFPNRMLLAEANLWPEQAISYFGEGDECHMAFHFPLMPRLFMAVRMEDRFPIIDILGKTPAIPEGNQWVLFLRNHDELTLETVTEEERDYMYREYAYDPRMRINLGIRRRLAPLLGNHRRRIELMNGLLFSLPGTPVIYYGDEIGMGDNIYLRDRKAVRTPMQWSADRNAGFSSANRQQLFLPVIVDPEYHYETVNVEAQLKNPHSLLGWTRRLIALRKQYKAFGRGTIDFLYPENQCILAFVRRYQDERILVVANLSRFVQHAHLDLSPYRGLRPVELFGRVTFPEVGDQPYFFTLGPHSFYWFSLEPREAGLAARTGEPQPVVADNWEALFQGDARTQLARALPAYLSGRRWFEGRVRPIAGARIVDVIPVTGGGLTATIIGAQVDYAGGEHETYLLPLALATGDEAERLQANYPQTVVAPVRLRGQPGILFDAVQDPRFSRLLLDAIARRRPFKGERGRIEATPGTALRRLLGPEAMPDPILTEEQPGLTSVHFGNHLVLKLLRRSQRGVNLDVELGRLVAAQASAAGILPMAGSLEYHPQQGEPATVALLQPSVPAARDGWQYTLTAVSQFLERILNRRSELQVPLLPEEPLVDLAHGEIPPLVRETLSPYAAIAEALGRRTAQMHLALAAGAGEAQFAPEPFTPSHQRSLFQSMQGQASQTLQMLHRHLPELSGRNREEAQRVLELHARIEAGFAPLREHQLSALRIRCHGDFHLGHVLVSGGDVLIAGFAGVPPRTRRDRRWKRTPLCDVAGLAYSFHHAAHTALHSLTDGLGQDLTILDPWARFWSAWTAAVVFNAYLRTADGSAFVPGDRGDMATLLHLYLLDTAIGELRQTLTHQPDEVLIPLRAIQDLIRTAH